MNEELSDALKRDIQSMKERVAAEVLKDVEAWLLFREKQTRLSIYTNLSKDCMYLDIKKKYNSKLIIKKEDKVGVVKEAIKFKEFFVQESRKGNGIVWIIIDWFKRRK